MPIVKVNGVNLYYEQEGKGPSVIFIAGYTCDLNYWMPIRAAFAKHFQVTLFDNRGAGRSDSPDEAYFIEDMASDTARLIEALDLKKPHVIASSMGTAITQTLVKHAPPLVDKIVLTNPLLTFDGLSAHAFQWLIKLREQGVSPELLIEGVLPWIFSKDFLKKPENVHSLIELMLSNPYPQTLVGQKRQFAALRHFNSHAWYKDIKTPALIIGGAEDLTISIEHAKDLAKDLANAQLYIFPNMGHAPNVENPKQYAQIVLDFLKA